MSFLPAFVPGQGLALLALAVVAGLAGGWCWTASLSYARRLHAGGQADASGLAAALSSAARVCRRRAWLAALAVLRGRPRLRRVDGGCLASAALLAAGCTASMSHYGFTPHALLVCVAGAQLLLLALIDARTWLLPDALTLPLLWMGLALCWMGWGTVSLHNALAGAMAGYGVLWLLQQGFRRVRGLDGMGHGDLKLLAALGAWVGWQALPWVLLAACVSATVFAMARQRTLFPSGAYPFGPFLAMAGMGVFILGSEVHLWFYR
ncbi:A24 family peptidase [Pusillimonas sp. SM2304]|uniref:prepilin peptidase n=1 Tax=Pusillimonas sp. SM2304 TaxID=3073241 RepID=UPI002875BF73|nr:A24 family peptidase [Pusillimonas sp. SM2304]MDS1139231.1 A24 family peptidase [Pusillimonas sp. SM2304]